MPGRARVTVTIRSNRIAAVISRANTQARAAVDASALNIQERAAQVAPVDTGSLRESIYVTNGETSDYNTRVAAAESVNDDVVILDEVDPEFVISPSSSSGSDQEYFAVIGVAASHGAHQEYGTRFTRAQPYMTPSALGEEGNFIEAMSRIFT